MNSPDENPFSLTGKKILITGASSGIGRHCAVRCSYAGATLIITARDEKRLGETLSLLRQGNHTMHIGDLTDPGLIEKLVETIVRDHGKIDGLVSAAGIETTIPLQVMKPKDYQLLFNINVISPFDICRHLLLKNTLEKKSSLVFIASVMGLLGQAGKIGYCSSKGALISGVKAMALELAARGIRANSILPAICRTPLAEKMFSTLPAQSVEKILAAHPLGFGEPDDVAMAAQYLLSDASRWVTGSEMVVDGGYRAQ